MCSHHAPRQALSTLLVGLVLLPLACAPREEARVSRSERSHVSAPESGSPHSSSPTHGATDHQPRESIFLSSVPIRSSDAVLPLARAASSDEALARKLALSFRQGQPSELLASRFPQLRQQPEDGTFLLPQMTLARDASRPQQNQSQASFVIDFEEPSVKQLLEELAPEERSPRKLERFVSDYIEKKTYTRGFDIASQTARLRAGDCTEHAVLLAALLRGVKIPARVTLGIVIVLGPHGLLAGGHAWTEYFSGKEWKQLDAALYQENQVPIHEGGSSGKVFGVVGLDRAPAEPETNAAQESLTIRRLYLPRAHLEDEGPGYGRALSRLLEGTPTDLALAAAQ